MSKLTDEEVEQVFIPVGDPYSLKQGEEWWTAFCSPADTEFFEEIDVPARCRSEAQQRTQQMIDRFYERIYIRKIGPRTDMVATVQIWSLK